MLRASTFQAANMEDFSPLDPWLNRARLASTLVQFEGKINGAAIANARRRWGPDARITNYLERAAVGAGESSGLVDIGSQATQYVETQARGVLIDEIQGIRWVSPNSPFVRSARTALASWAGESKPIKVSPEAFSRATLAPMRISCFFVMSEEAARDESPAAERMLAADMRAALQTTLNEAFLSSAAAVALVSPAGIRNNANIAAASASASDDLNRLLSEANKAALGDMCWVLDPVACARLVMSAGGEGLAADLGLRGGSLLGLPAHVCDMATSESDGGSVLLLNPRQIIAVAGPTTVERSRHAMVELDDSPTGQSDTPVAASATMISLFQSGATAIRLSRSINWSAPVGSVIGVSGADWASPT